MGCWWAMAVGMDGMDDIERRARAIVVVVSDVVSPGILLCI